MEDERPAGIRAALHVRLLDGEERDRLQALRAATEENAPAYAAILGALVAARDRYEVELRTEQIAAALAAEGHPVDNVDPALEQLRRWGNVTATHDTARVARLEDFRRRRSLWQLTAAGQAAHDAIVAVLGASERSGSLQRTLFREIRDNLGALATAVDAADPDATYLRLRDLDGALRELAANARDFHAAIAQLRREHEVDPTRFLAYKHQLIEYLEQFLEHLATQRTLIVRLVEGVEARGVDRLVELAAAGDDSAGLFGEVDLAARWRQRWQGLAAWFVAAPGRRAGAEELTAATTSAIRDLLDLLRRLTESARRPITRASELVHLARWFARLGDDGDADALFDAAFGLGRTVHLGQPDPDPDRTGAATSWWAAEPVDVPVTLREHGRHASPGRPGKAEDYAATKAWLAAEHRAAQAARAEAAACLVARPVEGRVLSDAEFAVALELLDRAAHRRPVAGAAPGASEPVVVEGAVARLVPDPAGFVLRSRRGSLTIDGARLEVRAGSARSLA
ncbi:MAG: TIGR02677 family protein [Actinobacteria bacterium]|nr:TIGR02677 family protein [Actinomycetota bacterium]